MSEQFLLQCQILTADCYSSKFVKPLVVFRFSVCSGHFDSLVPRPLPPEERPGTHCLRMREILRSFSVKSFVHFLVRMRKIILTKNTELSLRYTLATNQLAEPCRDTFQMWQCHFSKVLPKRAVCSHTSSHRNTYLSSYTVRLEYNWPFTT